MSLKRRFLVFLLLPVTTILLIIGIGGFFFIQKHLLGQWSESAQLKLEKVAHEIGMRMDEKLQLMDLIARTANLPGGSRGFLIEQLRDKVGVRSVELESDETDMQIGRQVPGTSGHNHSEMSEGNLTMEPDFRTQTLRIGKTVPGENENPSKHLTVKIDLGTFLAQIQGMDLWKGSSACLVTSNGSYLAHTDHSMHDRATLGEAGDPLEKRVLKSMRTRTYGTIFGTGYPPDLVIGFYRVPSTDWYVILFSKGSIILEPIIRFVVCYLLTIVGSVTTIFLLMRTTTGSVARSVGQLASAAARIEDGDYTIGPPESRSDEIGYLNRSFNQMVEGLRQRDLMQGIFGRYVDTSVATALMKRTELLRMGGEERVVTILMADLTGFTEMAAEYSPEEVVKVLNSYLSGMIGVISSHNGIIVDFLGAGILAFFDGVKTSAGKRAANAVECALEMRNRFRLLQDEVGALGAAQITIGIHTGAVIVGNIGAQTRTKYGIVGSAVNLTQRIKSSGTTGSILISGETYQMVRQRVKVGGRSSARLKGVEHPVDIYLVESIGN